MAKKFNGVPATILLVEDNDADVILAEEALGDGRIRNEVHRVRDGLEALDFLNRAGDYTDAPRPDVILLDLNMPRMDGREFLEAIKDDNEKKSIPIIVLTTSEAETDVAKSYDLNVNCYIQKPVGFNDFVSIVHAIEHFWFSVVSLPDYS